VSVAAFTGSITGLVSHKGELWASTTGGVLRWDAAGRVRHFVWSDGLPTLRCSGIQVQSGQLIVLGSTSSAWTGTRFSPEKIKLETPTKNLKYNGQTLTVFPGRGLLVNGKPFPFPPPTPNVSCAVIDPEGKLSIGTTQGVFQLAGKSWIRLAVPPGGLPADAVNLVEVQNRPIVAPREAPAFAWDPKLRRPTATAGKLWRTAVVWGNRTIVRCADSKLVEVGPSLETKPVGFTLPRLGSTAIAVSGKTLFVAQHGGWSEFDIDGSVRHRFDVPILNGEPTTAISAFGPYVAIGTQRAGLILWDREQNRATHLHEIHGLRDDWITALALDESGGLLIGTFVGGLHTLTNGKVKHVGLAKGCITRLLPDNSSVWVGSLTGVYRWQNERLTVHPGTKPIEPDVTDLLLRDQTLWVAAGGALHILSAKVNRSSGKQ
jgi:ligand-binding sensor domain-containing protein